MPGMGNHAMSCPVGVWLASKMDHGDFCDMLWGHSFDTIGDFVDDK